MTFKPNSVIQSKKNGIKAKVLFVNENSNIIQVEYLNPPLPNYEGVHCYPLREFKQYWIHVDEESSTNKECNHKFVLYEGLTESYSYCSICDKKE